MGDIGAVLSAVQNYKNETRAKFVDGHGESRPLLTISGGLISQVALIFQISESSYYTACTGTAIKHKQSTYIYMKNLSHALAIYH